MVFHLGMGLCEMCSTHAHWHVNERCHCVGLVQAPTLLRFPRLSFSVRHKRNYLTASLPVFRLLPSSEFCHPFWNVFWALGAEGVLEIYHHKCWAPHSQLSFVFWPNCGFCLLQKETSLMKSESCPHLDFHAKRVVWCFLWNVQHGLPCLTKWP